MTKRLLVTGGLGFIGSNFIRYILETTDYSVINLDKQTYSGNPENLRDLESDKRYQYVKGDVVDAPCVESIISQVDSVVHFAAETHVDRSIEDPQAFLRTNIIGTYTLLEAARKADIKQFLHVSTDEVYGSIGEGEFSEADPLSPNSPYASSKASSDLLARSYFITYKLPIIITRCSNNFGPYQYPEKAIPLLITNSINDEPFPLYGDGRHVRDWLYVLDHAKAIALLLEKGSSGEIYNIGGTASLPNKELVQKILSNMGKPDSLIQHVEDRAGHDRRYALNCDKIKALGWSPETSFDSALQDTIDWYSANPTWWRSLKESSSFQSYYKKQYADRFEAAKES